MSAHVHREDEAVAKLIYVTNAKAMAGMVVDLLADGGKGAREVVAKARPPMTRQQYLEFQRRTGRREVYEGGA